MEKLICICCPKGCHLEVDVENEKVYGNSCKKGERYGLSEIVKPKRIITSTVSLNSKTLKRLSVKTSKAIDRNLMMDVMKEIQKVTVNPPIKMNQVIIKDILNTGSDLIATKEIDS